MNKTAEFNRFAQEQVQINSGGGFMALFGLPFFIAGLVIALMALDIIPFDNSETMPLWTRVLMVTMGLAFVSVGAVFLFGRKWITIDRITGEIRESKGMLVPMKTTVTRLDRYNQVELSFESGDSDSADRYHIALRSDRDKARLFLHSAGNYPEAFEKAADLSKFLKFSLIDSTTDHYKEYQPGETEKGYSERLREVERIDEYVMRPRRMKSEIDRGSGQLQIKIPRQRFGLTGFLPLMIPLAVFTYFLPKAMQFFDDTDTPQEIVDIMLLIGIILFGVIPILAVLRRILVSIRGHTLVTIEHEELMIKEQEALFGKMKLIPLQDIIDTDYGTASSVRQDAQGLYKKLKYSDKYPVRSQAYSARQVPDWLKYVMSLVRANGIMIKSRSGVHTFGAGLPEDEIKYLHSIILQKLAQ